MRFRRMARKTAGRKWAEEGEDGAVTGGLTETAGQKSYSFTYLPTDKRHFRLRKP